MTQSSGSQLFSTCDPFDLLSTTVALQYSRCVLSTGSVRTVSLICCGEKRNVLVIQRNCIFGGGEAGKYHLWTRGTGNPFVWGRIPSLHHAGTRKTASQRCALRREREGWEDSVAPLGGFLWTMLWEILTQRNAVTNPGSDTELAWFPAFISGEFGLLSKLPRWLLPVATNSLYYLWTEVPHCVCYESFRILLI